MDLLSQHEAFLRAIFDAPDDDTPRLVYADFLQENGEEDRAEFIRVQCELATKVGRTEHFDRIWELKAREYELLKRLEPDREYLEPHEREHISHERGFCPAVKTLLVTRRLLTEPFAVRWNIVRREPHYFGAEDLAVDPGLCLEPHDLSLLFGLSVTRRVTTLYLDGDVREEVAASPGQWSDVHTAPAITTAGVEALANHKGVRRITSLDLRNNELDNDAARALVKSPYLDNLKRLQLLEGNRLRGRVWQQVIERFGEDVVG